jgi:hypothetical protein
MSQMQKPVPASRHALNLPAGSVRALLALGVLGMLWALALWHRDEKLPVLFIYLQYLMVLILAHFFASHGSTIGSPVSGRSPLGLPRGSLRLLLIVGYVGLAAFVYHTHPEFESPPTIVGDSLVLLAVMVSAFFLGVLVTAVMRVLGGGTLPYWFQDVQAWVALLGLFGLAFLAVLYLINTGLTLEDKIEPRNLQAGLAGLIGFYFGSRS